MGNVHIVTPNLMRVRQNPPKRIRVEHDHKFCHITKVVHDRRRIMDLMIENVEN